MPPQKKDKRKHNRGRRVAGFDEIKRREAEANGLEYKDPKQFRKESEDEDESSDSEEETPKAKEEDNKPKKKAPGDVEAVVDDFEIMTLNKRGGLGQEREGEGGSGQLTRKQKEEIQKEAAKKRYEKLHAEGKTEEAQADLARLKEVRERREAAKKKRDEEEAAKEAQALAAKKGNAEYVAALGGDRAKMPGEPRKKVEDGGKDMFSDYTTEKKAETIDASQAQSGSIEACRLAEDDFM